MARTSELLTVWFSLYFTGPDKMERNNIHHIVQYNVDLIWFS